MSTGRFSLEPITCRAKIPHLRHFVFAAALLFASLISADAHSLTLGSLRGKVIGQDNGEPLAFADLLLIPADTTQKRVGGVTNNDGTFELQAPVGTYTLQVRYLSYATKRLEGVQVTGANGGPITIALKPDAILQEEVVVEGRLVQDNESALLQQRKKAATVGDAVSAELIRRSPDKDAADVLRRVTGLSVTDNKYVFVRGLGERYSSTELDGVRLVSPEQNKRVVPLDLLPANLLENVTIQKTYSADRPGEFGGGDVQVRTRDFPDRQTFSISVSQGFEEGTTFSQVPGYLGSNQDRFGMGGDFRELPDLIVTEAEDRRLAPRGIDPTQGFTYDSLSMFGQSFRNIWSSSKLEALPNGSLSESYGNEFKLFGRPLGVVQSFNYARETEFTQNEVYREYRSFSPRLDLTIDRAVERVQLGGLLALGYRLTPAHTISARTVYTRSADDETRLETGYYEDIDANLRDTRLKYTERSVLTGVLGGRHDLRALLQSRVDWKLSGSAADWDQPDRRETVYGQSFYVDDNDEVVETWNMVSLGGGGASREFGAQDDRGWGFDGSWSLPMAFGPLGRGKLDAGYSHQEKDRDYSYRRFVFRPAGGGGASPESLFQENRWLPNSTGARIQDNTFPDDYYEGRQEQNAGFLSLDLPVGRRLRAVVGARVEHATQYVRSYDPFTDATASTAELDDVDWLPSANLTWFVNDRMNLRLAASRTLSRPDLRELSPSRDFDHPGGAIVFGNPDLIRSRLDNYDLRLETFPSVGEVFAIGGFYKKLHQPIELAYQPGDTPRQIPINSEWGRNAGLEVEARTSLGRFSDRLHRFFLNANYSVIESRVRLDQAVPGLERQSVEHPLAGQAAHLANASIQYTSNQGRFDVAVLFGRTGRRLRVVGIAQPDVYVEAQNTLDANLNWAFAPAWKMKLAATGILKEPYRELQGSFVTREYYERPGYSVGMSYAPF